MTDAVSLEDIQDCPISELPLWRAKFQCPKCGHKVMFTIGDEETYKSFRAEDKIHSCPHCKEVFQLYCHPCYICGKKGWSKSKEVLGSELAIYLCFDHQTEYYDLSSIVTREITGENTYPSHKKVLSQMMSEELAKARKRSEVKVLVNEYRSPYNWKFLIV